MFIIIAFYFFFLSQVMGGQGSDMFEYFKILILQGLVAARKHSDKIITLVDVMRAGNYILLDIILSLQLHLIKKIIKFVFMSVIFDREHSCIVLLLLLFFLLVRL